MNKKPFLLLCSAFLLSSCVTSPTGRSQLAFMPTDEMDKMGVQAFDNIKQDTPLSTDKRKQAYVTCIANAIVRVSNSNVKNWEIAVFDDAAVNAFALPGGKIGVYTGLLPVANNQHQLAAVIGHEVGHVLAQHGNERTSQQTAVQLGMSVTQALISDPQSQTAQMAMAALGVGAQYGILLPYGRTQESEADVIGLQLMASAGFDPRQSIPLWQNMAAASQGQPPEFLSTHPSHENRIQGLSNAMPQALKLYENAKRQGQNPNCHL
ncbi:M48 family metallopeptidase [Beggiatoa leptomitoformis]|uniref:M48 family metalloprotease n=1 Tax=Beggiatoa leptomitoformis TaxID=288004 RepID=A0A2N9YGB8_9GAMM|nr:M48 family metallopeptidase [Beggiatoa leptomitoformis]ALG68135.1 M48 family metalloprotease [Beggiatoa leptomitoformis]AUI69568.1 M48 family metalloprotease [Beggiatoa leptomitoformis]